MQQNAIMTGLFGWGARTRTWEWRNQNPLPYHLATPQQAARCHHGARTIAARLGPINGRRRGRPPAPLTAARWSYRRPCAAANGHAEQVGKAGKPDFGCWL